MDAQITNFLKILRMVLDDPKEFVPEEPADWAFLSETARKQNLLPLFFEAAVKLEEYTKSDVYAKDQLDTFGMVAAQIRRSSAFVEIYEKITARGIYPIVMKGIVCRQLYGELGDHRPSGDEDILVEVKDFPKVKEILEQENYVCSEPGVTECELNQLQEVSFYNPEQDLTLEVHTNIIGKENDERVQMNSFFQKIHEHGQMTRVYGADVKVAEPTESLLFLVLHAYKHFQNRGVGIRQILDILLYYREYKCHISMDILLEALKVCRAEKFWLDILYIGKQYLGLCEEAPESAFCPEELLQDMIHAGVFGGQENTDHVAARVNLSVGGHAGKTSKVYRLFRAAFPTKQVLIGGYPYLAKQPWRLPLVWVKRWIKYVRYTGKDMWKISSEILRKSDRRMEIIEKYKK